MPASVAALILPPAQFKIVYERGIAQSVEFKRALESRADTIHILKHDPAATFRELYNAGHMKTTIAGCTKGAAAFVLGELARSQGGTMVIYGEHRYLPGAGWQHSLLLPPADVARIKHANNWSREMAAALKMARLSTEQATKQVLNTTISKPAKSPDYLVTWGISG